MKYFQPKDRVTTAANENTIPMMRRTVSCSPKRTVPMRMVMTRLVTDQSVPTTDKFFPCISAGNQASTPRQYMQSNAMNIPIPGASTNLFERYSPPVKNIPERISQSIVDIDVEDMQTV